MEDYYNACHINVGVISKMHNAQMHNAQAKVFLPLNSIAASLPKHAIFFPLGLHFILTYGGLAVEILGLRPGIRYLGFGFVDEGVWSLCGGVFRFFWG